jgi:hypothetical protein
VWDSVARLKSLKSLTFSGLTNFTMAGMLRFVEQLGDGNQGLMLAIDNAVNESALTSEEQDTVREALAAKVEGSLAYQLLTGKATGSCAVYSGHQLLTLCTDPNMPKYDDTTDDSD